MSAQISLHNWWSSAYTLSLMLWLLHHPSDYIHIYIQLQCATITWSHFVTFLLFSAHVIHLTTTVTCLMTIIKTIVSLTPVIGWLDLWPQWLKTKILGSVVAINQRLPVFEVLSFHLCALSVAYFRDLYFKTLDKIDSKLYNLTPI